MRKVLVWTLICFSVPAGAADWRFITESSEGNQLLLDVTSISADDNYRSTWQKTRYKMPEKSGAAYSIEHWQYDCPSRRAELLSYIDYADDSSFRRSQDFAEYERKWQDVAPDTVGETVLNFVCRLPVKK